MKNPIQTFAPNLEGRDFVVGDLHGSLSCLTRLMQGIKFDKRIDRMYSTGDLGDRGPDSLGCLNLVHAPWFHSVFANHEQIMIDAFENGPYGGYWLKNGGYWGLEALNDHDRQEPETRQIYDALAVIKELPLLITVELKSGKKIHIIHAELPPNKHITDDTLADPAQVLALAQEYSYDGSYFLWGRYIFNALCMVNMENKAKVKRIVANTNVKMFNDALSHIISGHSILQRPMTVIGQTNIDTGAYCSYDGNKRAALTCIELDSWTFYQATESTFKVVQPLVVNKEMLSS